jgi:hypothetical protein
MFVTMLAIGHADAATITFDGPGPTTTISSWSEAGFNVAGGGDLMYRGTTGYCGPSCADNGTFWIGAWDTYQSTWANVIEVTGSGPFTFQGFDGAENPFAGNRNQLWAQGVEVKARKTDGTWVNQQFFFDMQMDGTGGLADFQSFAWSTPTELYTVLQFQGIAAASGGHDFTIDHLVLNTAAPVPEPASMLLFGSGAVAMIARRYRRRDLWSTMGDIAPAVQVVPPLLKREAPSNERRRIESMRRRIVGGLDTFVYGRTT